MIMPAADTGRPDGDDGPGRGRRLPRPAGLALGTLASLASELIVEHYDPVLGKVMTACDLGVPAGLAVVLFAVIMFGSDASHERAFRLLRWIRDKPEPPGPPMPPHRQHNHRG
jgi:hypothetical protein